MARPSAKIDYFLPFEPSPYPGALGRYLSVPSSDFLDAYLEAYTAAEDVVLDPLCTSDALARAAARHGRRAVLAEANPIAAFVARTPLLPVTAQDLKLAVQRLAEVKVGKVSLATHLDSLYASPCPACGAPAIVTEYVWERLLDVPVAKRCVCLACQHGIERPPERTPAGSDDIVAARRVPADGALYDYLSRRLGHGDGESELDLSGPLLDLYTPRAIYALTTLLRQIEGGRDGPNVQQVLKLALLECLCACSRLELADGKGERTTEIDFRPPSHYRERNVWRWFLAACAALRPRYEARGGDLHPVRLGASVGRVLDANAYGRLGNPPNVTVVTVPANRLPSELPAGAVALAIGTPPGPEDGLFQCLSYLWADWLLGPDAGGGLEQIPCSRRPLDWDEYYSALAAGLLGVSGTLRPAAPLVLTLSGGSERQVDYVVLAAIAAGFDVRKVLCREAANGQSPRFVLEFRRPGAPDRGPVDNPSALEGRRLDMLVSQAVEEAVREVLASRAEPSSAVVAHAAALEKLGQGGLLRGLLAAAGFGATTVVDRLYKELNLALDRGTRRGALLRLDGSTPVWMLAHPMEGTVAACDRAELAVYHHLCTNKTTTEVGTQRVVHALFPDLTTPPRGWVEECLKAYGHADRRNVWRLLEGDDLPSRLEEHAQAVAWLVSLGHRFGYKVWVGREEQKRAYGEGNVGQLLSVAERYASPAILLGGSQAADVDVIWYDGATAAWLFEVEWTCALSPAIVSRRLPAKARRYVVLADERVPLLQRKLSLFPWLQALLVADGWQFITWSKLATFGLRPDASAVEIEGIAGLPSPKSRSGDRARQIREKA